MQKYETTLTMPCDVGDQFWIFDKTERQAAHVECTGYVISKDIVTGRDAAYIWVDGINTRGFLQQRIPFHEFYSTCFKTRKEAEKSGSKGKR